MEKESRTGEKVYSDMQRPEQRPHKQLSKKIVRTRLVLFGEKVESSNEGQKNGAEQLTKSWAEKQIMLKLVL